MFDRLKSFLFEPKSIAPLVVFRIIFGLATFISTARFLYLGWVDLHFVNTQVQFKYFGFEWVQLATASIMYAIHYLMLAASLGIVFGAFYRVSAIMFFISFTYCELIDITYYLNHYYFVSLIAFLLIWMPANAHFSWDAFVKPSIRKSFVPAFTIQIFKFQLILVYFFAGIAKINYTWLMEALPLKIWLPANSDFPFIGWLFNYPLTAHVFSWAGMLFDISIGLFLLLPQTRFFAWLLVLFFHLLTGALFQIGVFPLVMVASTLIFFSAHFHQNILLFLNKFIKFPFLSEPNYADEKPTGNLLGSSLITGVILCWVSFHILFPLRYVLYPGNLFWTEEAYRFGWRVMLMEKAGTATFYVQEKSSQREGVVDNSDFLNVHQEKQMAMQPDLILQYAQFLKNHYQRQGVSVDKVSAEVYVTLNAKPSKLLFNPQLNLLEIVDSWAPKTWLNRFEE
ncbi:MAG: HTTM domain-containing protein [Bacteroidota bacterium]|nr:HTTM domain-containing protein [Bacteroidota bacterium]